MKASLLGQLSTFFGTLCTLDIEVDFAAGRKTTFLDIHKSGVRVNVYSDTEEVTGSAIVALKPGRKIDHQGIKVELIGELSTIKDTSAPYVFFSCAKDLESPGTLYESKTYRWKFAGVEKVHDTYMSPNVNLRYFVRLSVSRSFSAPLSKCVDIAVENRRTENEVLDGEISTPIKMEVGIEDCLHIEFEYNKNCYHLNEVVFGKVNFVLVRLKIKYMELDILRTETIRVGSLTQTETETISKFEVMDGAAVKGEVIPVRLHLSASDLTPTYNNVLNRFSVKYFLNLVLVDQEDRRYFKKQEIILYRTRSPIQKPKSLT